MYTIRQKALPVVLITLACVAMAAVDAILQPTYAVKSAVKWLLFVLVPLLYSAWNQDISLKSLFAFRKKGIWISFAIGLGLFCAILSAYFAFSPLFDLSGITKSLGGSLGVHAGNFIYVSLYIAVVNSFLEEFFFRGFSFLCLKAKTGRKFAFLFSAAMFSLYHAAMTIGWFSPLLLCLILLVLFGTGLFLNYVDEKSQTLYNSYFMHMFANFAINTIGFILFGK